MGSQNAPNMVQKRFTKRLTGIRQGAFIKWGVLLQSKMPNSQAKILNVNDFGALPNLGGHLLSWWPQTKILKKPMTTNGFVHAATLSRVQDCVIRGQVHYGTKPNSLTLISQRPAVHWRCLMGTLRGINLQRVCLAQRPSNNKAIWVLKLKILIMCKQRHEKIQYIAEMLTAEIQIPTKNVDWLRMNTSPEPLIRIPHENCT